MLWDFCFFLFSNRCTRVLVFSTMYFVRSTEYLGTYLPYLPRVTKMFDRWAKKTDTSAIRYLPYLGR